MKILFLDVDGVLNHYGDPHWIAPECLARLRRILDATGARPVLSSDWKDVLRRPEEHDAYTVNRVNALYEDPSLRFAGMTPDIDPGCRELEVGAWLDAAPEPVESFAILDDLHFGFPERFPGNFVHVAGMSGGGLTDADADKAIEILSLPTGHRKEKT